MALAGRNDPCPCGSGRKFKRCCIEREAELRRRQELMQELLALGGLFPVLRPLEPAFESWASDADIDRESVETALNLLSEEECQRIFDAAATHCGDAWTTAAAEYGDEAEAELVLLTGAVVAAAQECRDSHWEWLEELEQDPELAADPLDTLEEALLCSELWSLPEALAAEAAIGPAPFAVPAQLERAAREAWTPDHEQRLRFLVGRIASRLPADGLPTASAALAAACAAVERDEDVRMRIAATMLGQAIPLAQPFLTAAA